MMHNIRYFGENIPDRFAYRSHRERNFRKHSSVLIPTAILSQVRELISQTQLKEPTDNDADHLVTHLCYVNYVELPSFVLCV